MSDLSNTREQTVLNNIAAGGVYVSLHSADEGDEPDGSNEVGAADYGREPVAEADLTVSGTSPTTLTNDAPVNWGTTQNNWGTISHAALWSTEQGGTGEEPYTATIALENGGDAPSGIEVKINAGDLTFTID